MSNCSELAQISCVTACPSGLRGWSQVPVRKCAGSNPAAVIFAFTHPITSHTFTTAFTTASRSYDAHHNAKGEGSEAQPYPAPVFPHHTLRARLLHLSHSTLTHMYSTGCESHCSRSSATCKTVECGAGAQLSCKTSKARERTAPLSIHPAGLGAANSVSLR